METVLQFEDASGEILASWRIPMTSTLKSLGKKIFATANALVALPDDSRELTKYFSSTENFGQALRTELQTANAMGLELEDFPDGCRLTVLGDREVHRLPWEAVGLREGWLGTRYALKRVPTLAEHSDVHAIKQPSKGIVSVHNGNWTFFLGQGDGLVGTVSEHNLVELWMRDCKRTAFGKGEVHTVGALTASREKLLEQLSKSCFFHYAGHSRKHAELAVRCFAPEAEDTSGQVTSSDIEELPQVPEYLYLNGCGLMALAATEPIDRTEIPLLFLQKGSRWVVGPTVPFLTYRYYQLIRQYYQNLDPRYGNPAEAMRKSRQSLFEGGKICERELPLALQSVVYGCLGDWAIVRKLETEGEERMTSSFVEGSGARYPTVCSRCGAAIQTKFGNYAKTETTPPVCSKCNGTDVSKDSLIDDSNSKRNTQLSKTEVNVFDTPQGNHALSAKQSSVSFASQESELSLSIRRRIADNARQFAIFYHPIQKRELNVVCSPVDSATKADGLTPFLRQEKGLRGWQASFELTQPDWRLRKERLALLLIQYVETSDLRPLERLEVDEIFRALDLAAASADQHNSGRYHRYHIVVSSTGFSNRAMEFVEAVSENWRDEQRSMILYDSNKEWTRFSKLDRLAYSVESFFRSHAIDEQFGQIIDWLEGQLPLQESLSVRAIAEQTGFSEEVIDSAIRIFARRHKLALLESNDFGLCVEDSLISKAKRSEKT
jgi:hypothetical protein